MSSPSFIIICFFLYLSSFVAIPSHARQEEALHLLQKIKLNRRDSFDTTLFEEVELLDGIRILSQGGLKEKDKIERLPGQPHVEFTQYGGYVTVDENAGRAFYYYFVEAERSKESKPLLLWLNGGPGCHSLGYGAMQELGPFRVHSDGKTLFKNNYAWNKVANVLFLESPAGVGFSYSNTISDIDMSGDRMTANDNYAFLVNWLERFPEYKTRDFYISGESHAGHYVPELAHTIIKHNELRKKNIINLKGIIIGNPLINDITDRIVSFDFLWTHALISDELIKSIRACNYFLNATDNIKECEKSSNEVSLDIDPINRYNIYAPICLSSNLTDKPGKASSTLDSCSEDYVYAYMNNPDVQNALHANVTQPSFTCTACSHFVWRDWPSTMLPLLQEFMAKGLRVWLFSGDMDGVLPVTSTRYSLNKLKLPTKTKYHPWFVKAEVGGYALVYKGDLTFATVRGAGHQVPSYQPLRALALIKHFLDGTPLPTH